MYEFQLTDDTGTQTLPELNVPFTTSYLEGTTDVTTLSFNVYTDFFAQKRAWTNTYSFLTEAEFNVLKGFYDRQFTLFQYPRLTIERDGIVNVPVRFTLSPKNVVDNCGTVAGVTISFRESQQLADTSS